MTQPLRIGIIGFGGIAQRSHLPVYQKLEQEGLAQVVAVCDINEAMRSLAREKYGIAQVFGDYRELLACTEIDAVDLCTPNFFHHEPAIAAFAAGKHVLCEKPLAINAQHAAAIVAASQSAGKKLQVALPMRFGPGPQTVKRFLDTGSLGEIYYARAHALRRRGIPGVGVFTQKDKQGGGPLIDIGVHILDITLWLMGYPQPVSVSGAAYTKFGNRAGVLGLRGQWDSTQYTVEDFAAGFVRFANGATLTIESSFAANIEHDQFQTHLLGTEGGVFLDPFHPEDTRIYREESGTLTDTTPVFLPKVDFYDAEIRAFVRAILEDTPVLVPGEQGLILNQIIDALYLSAETRREAVLGESDRS